MELNCIKNAYRFIASPLIENFKDFFFNSYLKSLNNKDFINEAKKLTSASFEKIEEKIKSYNQKSITPSEPPAKTPLDTESRDNSKSTMDLLDDLEEETPME